MWRMTPQIANNKDSAEGNLWRRKEDGQLLWYIVQKFLNLARFIWTSTLGLYSINFSQLYTGYRGVERWNGANKQFQSLWEAGRVYLWSAQSSIYSHAIGISKSANIYSWICPSLIGNLQKLVQLWICFLHIHIARWIATRNLKPSGRGWTVLSCIFTSRFFELVPNIKARYSDYAIPGRGVRGDASHRSHKFS